MKTLEAIVVYRAAARRRAASRVPSFGGRAVQGWALILGFAVLGCASRPRYRVPGSPEGRSADQATVEGSGDDASEALRASGEARQRRLAPRISPDWWRAPGVDARSVGGQSMADRQTFVVLPQSATPGGNSEPIMDRRLTYVVRNALENRGYSFSRKTPELVVVIRASGPVEIGGGRITTLTRDTGAVKVDPGWGTWNPSHPRPDSQWKLGRWREVDASLVVYDNLTGAPMWTAHAVGETRAMEPPRVRTLLAAALGAQVPPAAKPRLKRASGEGRLGIRFEVTSRDGYDFCPEVTDVARPAAAAGVRPGDRVIKIEDESVANPTVAGLFERLRGPVGEVVRLTLARGAQESESVAYLTRY